MRVKSELILRERHQMAEAPKLLTVSLVVNKKVDHESNRKTTNSNSLRRDNHGR
jgi:hypothetical protein